MFGAWSPEWVELLSLVARFVGIFVVLYFLALIIYWYNRTGKIPSLRTIFRMMIQFAKWFPRILVHRVRIVPARIRKKKVSAYPELGGISLSVVREKKSFSKKKVQKIKKKK